MRSAKPHGQQEPVLSKLPGLRRYTAEIERLRGELAAAQGELGRLRAAQPDPEWLANAHRYE